VVADSQLLLILFVRMLKRRLNGLGGLERMMHKHERRPKAFKIAR
jgi:hypothetical protein